MACSFYIVFPIWQHRNLFPKRFLQTNNTVPILTCCGESCTGDFKDEKSRPQNDTNARRLYFTSAAGCYQHIFRLQAFFSSKIPPGPSACQLWIGWASPCFVVWDVQSASAFSSSFQPYQPLWRTRRPSSSPLWPHKIEKSSSGFCVFARTSFRHTTEGNIFLDKCSCGQNTGKWTWVLVVAAQGKSSKAASLEDHSKQSSPAARGFFLTFSLQWIHALKRVHGQLSYRQSCLYRLSTSSHLLLLCPNYVICVQVPQCFFLGSNIA